MLYSVTASITFVIVFVIQTPRHDRPPPCNASSTSSSASQHSDNSLIAVEKRPTDQLQALADPTSTTAATIADTRPSYDAV